MPTPEPIPFLDLQTELASYRAEALAAIAEVVDSQRFILGEVVARFEAALAAWAGVPHAVGVSSGTDALLVSLMALGIGPGDEVVTTPFSFFATAGVVARLGARPVFADIDEHTFNLTESGVRAALSPRTRAIVPVHLFGQICDLGGLYDEPGRPPIVEDAAQSLGARLNDRALLGDLACVSFFPTKNLGAFGDAGAVLTADADQAARIGTLRVHGGRPKYHHALLGGNFRLDALQAAVLAVKLPHLQGWTDGRRRRAARYDALIEATELADRGLVRPPQIGPGSRPVFHQYVVRARDRDGLRAHLARRDIGTMIYYPGPLHLQPCFADLGYGPGDFPAAERAAGEVLALPVQPAISEIDQARVVEEMIRFYRL